MLWSYEVEVAAVRARVQERKSWTSTFTAGSCQCAGSTVRTGEDKDSCLLASCDGNWYQEWCYY